ncbi:MAG: helicase associated domain-containing protein, partial [Ruminococcus sp.]|nr:helicase associated domain-containing protein [Ruminococcus sp.]
GQWLNGLRSNRNGTAKKAKELTAEQISRLDALGMIWENKNELLWRTSVEEYAAYVKQNNTSHVPLSYVTKNGYKLGKWYNRQQSLFNTGKLSPERQKQLEAVGMVFDATDPWEKKFQLAKAYFEENGNLNVPAQFVVNGVWLAKWLNEQKLIAEGKRKKKHSPKQLAKLEAIGLRYGSTYYEEQWQERYEIAKAYYEKHGDLRVPYAYCEGDFPLGNWLSKQKSQYRDGNMPDEHYALLSAIGMDWDNAKEKNIRNSYAQGFQHLEAFIAEHGVDALTGAVICEDGYRLGSWFANCKTKYRNGKMPKKHILHFEKLGVQLEKSDAWEERFQEVKAYLEKNDTTYVPKGTYSESGYDLFSWVSDQRRAYKKGKLSAEQMKKLDEIGYPFLKDKKAKQEQRKKKWFETAVIVMEYVQSHSPDALNDKTEYHGIRVKQWLENQRSSLRLGKIKDSEQIDFLQKMLDLSLLAKRSHWEIMYEATVQFFEEHGVDADVPDDYEVSEGNLKAWLTTEKAAVKGSNRVSRSPEQLEMLAKIGITPDMKTVQEKKWDRQFERLKEFVAEKGRLPYYSARRRDEYPIAVWLNNQKKKAKQGLLSEEQLQKMREVGAAV